MKKFLLLSCVTVFLVACNSESSSATDVPPGEKDAEAEVLPCEIEGDFSWKEQGSSYYLCQDGSWKEKAVEKHVSNGFDVCQFNFGAAWQGTHEDREFYEGLDYIAVWLGDNDFYNSFEERMVDLCIDIKATPMIYAYVIAEFGKDHDMDDCDVAKKREKKSLCVYGANLIRDFFADSILFRYEQYASGLREQLEFSSAGINPDTYESIWLIEPDFYQYSEMASKQKEIYDSTAQLGGGIPDAEMGTIFKQIVSVIKNYLPGAKIAMDISPWINDADPQGQTKWLSNFDMSLVDFMSTSGGRTSPSSNNIRAGNKTTWKEIYEITRKPILADAGYDKGGEGTGHAGVWDDARNIKLRMADGVVGTMQMDAKWGYPSIADTVRPQLLYQYPWCKTQVQ